MQERKNILQLGRKQRKTIGRKNKEKNEKGRERKKERKK